MHLLFFATRLRHLSLAVRVMAEPAGTLCKRVFRRAAAPGFSWTNLLQSLPVTLLNNLGYGCYQPWSLTFCLMLCCTETDRVPLLRIISRTRLPFRVDQRQWMWPLLCCGDPHQTESCPGHTTPVPTAGGASPYLRLLSGPRHLGSPGAVVGWSARAPPVPLALGLHANGCTPAGRRPVSGAADECQFPNTKRRRTALRERNAPSQRLASRGWLSAFLP